MVTRTLAGTWEFASIAVCLMFSRDVLKSACRSTSTLSSPVTHFYINSLYLPLGIELKYVDNAMSKISGINITNQSQKVSRYFAESSLRHTLALHRFEVSVPPFWFLRLEENQSSVPVEMLLR